MQKVIFEVHTLTPLFMSGADQTQAELRAPTLRGVLHYWQRALIGGIVGTDEQGLAIVQHEEHLLFGTLNHGSPLSIQISAPSTPAQEFKQAITIRQGQQWQTTGLGYLLWPMARSGKAARGNVRPARWYFPPGTLFLVTLTVRSGYERQLQQAIASFWLLISLGGLGSRSHRCAGSLAARPLTSTITTLPYSLPAASHELKLQLEQGIVLARTLYEVQRRTIHHPRFDILAPHVCRIWILQDAQPWVDAETAMQTIGERLRDYRSHLNTIQRKIFGLPLLPLFTTRRASPLLLRISALSNNTYVGIAVLFKTSGEGIQREDYSIIEQWIDMFSAPLEVML